MKKIPTLFERDWHGDRSRVLPIVTPGCEWVIAGEGVPTQKLDGSACFVLDGELFKRREVKAVEEGSGVVVPGIPVDFDHVTKKAIVWAPVGDGPEDRWHREAFATQSTWPNGTYELVGPKVQGNPERYPTHTLIAHSDPDLRLLELEPIDRSFEAHRRFLAENDIEGIVYQHPDGRMAKIKARDFGIRRQPSPWAVTH